MSEAQVKIVRFHELGGPEVLVFDTMPLPEPGPGEVRLRVKAIGLNRAEVLFRQGHYLAQPQLPSKIGYEASGIVEAVGSGVDKQLLGTQVSTVPCFDGTHYGVYGEVAIVPAYAVVHYPQALSFEEAASIWMQYLTAYGALIHYGQLRKTDYVVITAASSSVGLAAIQMVNAEGAVSIAVTRNSNKKAELLALGARHVIISDDEDIVTRVHQITEGKGARIVFDPIGGPNVEKLAASSAMGGIIFIYGALAAKPTPFPLFLALSNGLSVRGYTLFEIMSKPELRELAQHYVFDGVQRGVLKPKIARTFKLAEIVAAHRYMESNEQVGKIVVTV